MVIVWVSLCFHEATVPTSEAENISSQSPRIVMISCFYCGNSMTFLFCLFTKLSCIFKFNRSTPAQLFVILVEDAALFCVLLPMLLRAGCFTFHCNMISCDYVCSLLLPCGALGWSAMCGRCIF